MLNLHQRILIVGQAPSATSNPDEPLTPGSRNGSANRLAAIMGISGERFVEEFERINLIPAHSGSSGKGGLFNRLEGATRARIIESQLPGRTVLFLGKAVAECFLGSDLPEQFEIFRHAGARCMWCHHTSGIVRTWNDQKVRDEALNAFDVLRWRHALDFSIAAHPADAPLILSGGVDSATILASLLSMDRKPECYTLRIGGVDTDDVTYAKRMCLDWGLRHIIVDAGSSEEHLISDLWKVFKETPSPVKRRTIIQNAHATMLVCDRVRADGYRYAYMGTGGVCLDNRKAGVMFGAGRLDELEDLRKTCLDDRSNPETAVYWMHRMAIRRGVKVLEPLSDEPLRSVALSIPFARMNTPRQKGITLRAYPVFWDVGYWRRNRSFQTSSGVKKWHEDVLLNHPVYNPEGFSILTPVYDRMISRRDSLV